jgi:hypothetical protein
MEGEEGMEGWKEGWGMEGWGIGRTGTRDRGDGHLDVAIFGLLIFGLLKFNYAFKNNKTSSALLPGSHTKKKNTLPKRRNEP